MRDRSVPGGSKNPRQLVLVVEGDPFTRDERGEKPTRRQSLGTQKTPAGVGKNGVTQGACYGSQAGWARGGGDRWCCRDCSAVCEPAVSGGLGKGQEGRAAVGVAGCRPCQVMKGEVRRYQG